MKKILITLTIITILIIVFDLGIYQHSAWALFEDGSFLLGKIGGCIPMTLCN